MAVNPMQKPDWELIDFISDEEHDLFDSVICEKTDIGGFPVLYYVKLNTDGSDVDEIYGEDPTEEFSTGYETKVLYDPTEEPQVLSIFGMSSDDTLQYVEIPKTIFIRDVMGSYLGDYANEAELEPKVGDVIRTLWNNKTYEIAELGSEQRIFQGKKMIWEFILKPYRHSEESDSADDLLFDSVTEDNFPDINIDTTSKELSAFGDNETITDSASGISTDVDSSVYGY